MSRQLLKRLGGMFFLRVKFHHLLRLLTILGVLLSVTACETSLVSTPTPAPKIIATAMVAIIEGQLVEIDGCLRVRDDNENINYALVWPPDLRVTIDGDSVNIVTGIVRGKQEEIDVQIGDWVRFSGGETRQISEELSKTLSPHCQEPYWVVGFDIIPIQVTEETE